MQAKKSYKMEEIEKKNIRKRNVAYNGPSQNDNKIQRKKG